MRFFSAAEIAKPWNVSTRTVRNYCAAGKIPDAFLTGKSMEHPRNRPKAIRNDRRDDPLKMPPERLRLEKAAKVSKQGVTLSDPTAEQIWQVEALPSKGNSKSKWLGYNMAMWTRVFDD